jgi:hypothetical protein
MPQADYVLISNGGAVYLPPGPPAAPHFNGAAAVVAGQQENHKRETQDYEKYQDLMDHIGKLLLDAIPKSYIGAIAHAQLGFHNTTPRQIMDYMLQRYGAIKAIDLKDNLKRLKAPWDPDTPIETVFDN